MLCRFVDFLQLWHGFKSGQFRGSNPAHFGCLPVDLNEVWGQNFQEEGMDVEVSSQFGITVLYHSAAPEHTYLIALQTGLFPNLSIGLLIGCDIWFNETAHSRPTSVVTSHLLATPYQQHARLWLIGAQKNTRYHVRWSQIRRKL